MNNRDLLDTAKHILKNGGVEAYAFDAACLFEHFFNMSRHDILISDSDPDPETARFFLDACKKRAGGYPLQYILGSWEFYGIDFFVSEDVLIPRADTETLIDYMLENYSGGITILDMCCGCGCIGLTLKKLLPESRVTLCDISEGALDMTAKNAAALNLSVKIKNADVTRGYEEYFNACDFDVIISNPPYIKEGTSLAKELSYEPALALFGGNDGLTYYRALITLWKGALRPGGQLVLETGFDTYADVITLLDRSGFTEIKTRKDAGGIIRAVCAKRYN